MALSDEKRRDLSRRLLLSRMRILINHGFYGLLLMHMIYALDEEMQTAATDGERIIFSPQFMDELSDSELDFVMMHEILHVVLRHCLRDGDRDHDQFNIACDIVVNSNILLSSGGDLKSITLKKDGPSMHLAPNGKEGHLYTAEEVYEMLLTGTRKARPMPVSGKGKSINAAAGSCDPSQKSPTQWDDHTRWGMLEEDETLRDVWVKRVRDAAEAISIRDPSNQRGLLPAFAQRMLKDLRKAQTDWRVILNEFIHEEITDYSFAPPDRRFDDSPFFLPDLSDADFVVENILFMIDTSGSMSDEMVTAAYSEVKGAIDQFDGNLRGWLGFFDAAIIEPQPFADEAEFRMIEAAGGGGTDFQIIFEYVRRYMEDNPPVCIIILTDGFAPFPAERLAGSIPVLWLLNNETVAPPWGKVARITL